MAEVEKVSAVAATTSASDIPVVTGGSSVELGTSPTQERSSNSHPHDSEYDTASDLEGGEEYDDDEDDLDDDDDEDGESITDEDDEDGSITDDDERQLGAGGIGPDKTDSEAQKKVDEDRSNPQYIPKRGTFYEHDDRTAEGEADGNQAAGEDGEQQDGSSATGGVKSPQSPTISQASKTMKKWQPASAVERWSHDRFEATEQAPKSRSELVSSYGYDIRTEDAPPRARRRRRYGRGPSKYSRNWEDENAYLKASNKERKPLRPSDFPALSERGSKPLTSPRGTREEKENRMGKRQTSEVGSGSGGEKLNNGQRSGQVDERREPRSDGKNNKFKSYGRQSGPVGRQAAMEFKQKQRSGQSNSAAAMNNMQNNRVEQQNDRQFNRPQNAHNSMTNEHPKSSGRAQVQSKQSQMSQNDSFHSNNPNRVLEHGSYQQVQSPPQQGASLRQSMPPKTAPTSNLSQRLQQVQQRNDPSHVGSVQMHALATQNQIIGQPQQPLPQPGNIMLSPPQQQQQQPPQQPQLAPQEQRGPPKRYSSLRRSQHEAQHVAEQHQLQQLHLQQQQQPPPPLLLQDQHMLQAANLMLYHQENLQAQMQALQVGPVPAASKQPSYTATQPPPPQPYAGAAGSTGAPPAAYYVATPDAYSAAATVAANAQAPPPAQYAPQQPPNYLPQAPTAAAAATLAYANAAPPAQQAVPGAAPATFVPPTAVPPTGAAGPTPQPAPPNANPNYPNYQNYNTVGGTTYFVPPPAQAAARPVVLPQRRPTNAIPILPPSEKNKQRVQAEGGKEEVKSSGAGNQPVAPIGSAENIDHIIDNMFVARPVFQPPTAAARKSSTPPSADNSTGSLSDANSSPPSAQPDDSGINMTISSNAEKTEDGAASAAENNNNGNAVTVTAQE